uniref:Quinic acid utilization activator n=1 Tax=Ganoderma boninense TaxID=34458 RepID=A0A5K1K4Q5_9APHY|nr:Quinic acid utilization activator [Ganoderma boninense]
MGVHGLTSYLRENKHTLSRTLSLPQPSLSQPIPLIVDAWSFIYEVIYCADLPWVFGGEYPSFPSSLSM